MKDLKLQLIRRGLPMVYACEGGKITESKKFLFSYIPEQDAIVLNKNIRIMNITRICFLYICNSMIYRKRSSYQCQEAWE